MKGVPIAVSLAYTPELILDPTGKEETMATSRHAFAWAFGGGLNAEEGDTELVWAESEGDFTKAQVRSLVDVAYDSWIRPWGKVKWLPDGYWHLSETI